MEEIELVEEDGTTGERPDRVCHIVSIGREKPRIVGAYHIESEARKQAAKLSKALRGSGLDAYVTSQAFEGRTMSTHDAWDRIDAIWEGSLDRSEILYFLDLVFLDQSMHVMSMYSDEEYQDDYHWCMDAIDEMMSDAIDEFAGKLSSCLLELFGHGFNESVDEINGELEDGETAETVDGLMYEYGFTKEQLAETFIRPLVRFSSVARDPEKEYAIVLNDDWYQKVRIMSKRALFNTFSSIEYKLSLEEE